MRHGTVILVILLAAALGVNGCETARETAREHPRATVGAGAGAAGGALLGGLIAKDTTGVVIGGLLGGLAGGGIGHYLDRQDKTPAQVASETGYQPAQGTVVRVDRVLVDPTVARPGDTVHLGTTYTILTPNPNQTVAVHETREVRHNGALVANPTTAFTRSSGTFTSALPISLPPRAERGNYEVITIVAIGDRSSRGMSNFVVQ